MQDLSSAPDVLKSFLERVREDRHHFLNREEATRIGIVLPILGHIGWDRDNYREIVPEFNVGTGRVDYCLRVKERNLVFVEVKRASEDLENHQEQLLDYAFREGVETAVLTNGLVWWLYLPLLRGSWDQRKFFTVDLLQQEPGASAQHFRDYLGRSGIDDGSAVRKAREVLESREKQRLIADAIPRAWIALCRDPDELLLELLAEKVEGLCGHQPDHATLAGFLPSLTWTSNSTVQSRTGSQNKTPSAVAATGRYTGKRPLSFTLRGNRHRVASWKDLYVKVCTALWEAHEEDFEKVLALRGRKRKYFTRDPLEIQQMTAPDEVGDGSIHVETNLSAENIVARCHELLEFLGYPVTDIQIEVEERTGL